MDTLPQRVLQLAEAVFEGVQAGALSTVNHLSVESRADTSLVLRREGSGQDAEQVTFCVRVRHKRNFCRLRVITKSEHRPGYITQQF